MAWVGYNFEDAVPAEHLIYEDIYTSFRIRKYKIQTDMNEGFAEKITKEITHLEEHYHACRNRHTFYTLNIY